MGRKELFEAIIAVGIIIGMIFSATAYFATAQDLKLVDLRLENKVVNDNLRDTRQMMWQLEDRYPGRPDCSTWEVEGDKKRYRILQEQLKSLELQRGIIMKESKGKL
jgi:hypothetical protein